MNCIKCNKETKQPYFDSYKQYGSWFAIEEKPYCENCFYHQFIEGVE